MLTEEASLNGECGIINETGGKVDVSVPLDNLNFAYKGNTNGSLTIKDTAVLGTNSEISNNTKGRITIYGKLKENSKINLEGNSAGYFVFGEHGVWKGNSKIINNGNYGNIRLDRLTVPDGTTIEYTSKGGALVINAAGGGIVTIEPGSHLRFVNNSTGNGSFANWENLYIKDCLLTLGGSGSGMTVDWKFGGELTVNNDGDCLVRVGINKMDWSGQIIRSRIYNLQKYTDKYLYICTGNISNFVDIEAHCRVWLYGSYADGTKIRVSGNTDYGHLRFLGKNSGNINLEFNAPSHNTSLLFYNDLNGLDGFSYTSANNGGLTVYEGVVLGRNIKIVNNSAKNMTIAKNVKIGNNVSINVSESAAANINISEDLPDGSVVNY